MKQLMAAFILGAFLVTLGMGCSSPSTPTKTTPPPGEKKEEKKP